MQEVNLSKANQAYINNAVNKASDSEVQVQQTEPKKDGNKKMKLALIGLGVVGAAAIGVGVAIKTGKIKLPNKTNSPANADDLKKGAEEIKDTITTKFSDLDKNIVDVTFPDKNGIAKTKDGLFSGTLEKAIKKEDGTTQNILVNYVNGKPTETKIDGVIRKTFEYNTDGTRTTKLFDKEGNFGKEIKLFFSKDNPNKVDRVFTKTKDDFGKYLEFENEKLKAKTSLSETNIGLSEIYDSEGNVVKTIKGNKCDGTIDIITPTEDGQKIVTGNPEGTRYDRAVDYKIHEPLKIRYLDKDGKQIKYISIDPIKGEYYQSGVNGNDLSMVIRSRDDKLVTSFNEFTEGNSIAKGVRIRDGVITNYDIDKEQKANFVEKFKAFISQLKEEGVKFNMSDEEIQAAIDKI